MTIKQMVELDTNSAFALWEDQLMPDDMEDMMLHSAYQENSNVGNPRSVLNDCNSRFDEISMELPNNSTKNRTLARNLALSQQTREMSHDVG